MNFDRTSADSVSSGMNIRMMPRSITPSTRSLNYSKIIGKHGMKKMIYCIELCRKHALDTPNQ